MRLFGKKRIAATHGHDEVDGPVSTMRPLTYDNTRPCRGCGCLVDVYDCANVEFKDAGPGGSSAFGYYCRFCKPPYDLVVPILTQTNRYYQSKFDGEANPPLLIEVTEKGAVKRKPAKKRRKVGRVGY